ncbi:Disintegrin and metalloproteinase domain-containing protein 8 [Saguinus oedipus]|uniref:Disintegrin and metalloproteinase domain-containing protein 8 n=1 Tax=Saguinus oedipus TaxID=9490 RepID=A0ABQ9USU5_SAGOE|nr:Disintegrin and metalloproteinase domain-containing protein 8 [Saguinus oedipus]
MVPSRPWAPLEQYEVVLPRRLLGPRARRSLPSHSGLYPERVSYVLAATGSSFTLHLRKNRDLLGSGYTETYTAANGSEVTEQPRGQDLCFYQGHVEGHADSAASISTCLGLRWAFRVTQRGLLRGPAKPKKLSLLYPRARITPGAAGGRAGGAVGNGLHLLGPATLQPMADPAPVALRGFFQVGSDLHLIEPLDEGGEGGRHAVYPAEQLLQTAGTCGVSNDTLGRLLGPRTAAVFRSRPGVSTSVSAFTWPSSPAGSPCAACCPPCGHAAQPGADLDPLSFRDTRYVELYVVVDNAEFQQVGSEAAVRHRVLEVVNHVDKLYQKLNIRVVLVGLEIWNGQDRFHVSPNFSVTLENLLAWRARGLTQRHPHDNVQLITAVDFTGDTVGFAKVSAMCSHSSGAVNQDHSKNPVGVACTMAHEMGHNLGMDHDEQVHGCRCREPSEGMHCVMAGRIR